MSSQESTPTQTHQEHRLVLSQDSHGTVHGTGPTGQFNTWLAAINEAQSKILGQLQAASA